eukprot:jgi/Mesen1/3562/ME000199S02720
MNPATFLRVLGPEPWQVAYVEPSCRPDDSRYGDNPNRVQKHTQFQALPEGERKPAACQSGKVGGGNGGAAGARACASPLLGCGWDSAAAGAQAIGYDHVLKTSHVFNILDARGAVGVTERARFFGRMRTLARQCAQLWVKTREELGFPLGMWKEAPPPVHPGEDSTPLTADEKRTFVLEIGSEELPPDDVSSAVRQLESAVPVLLARLRLTHGAVSVHGTPRRLAVVVSNLAGAQSNSSAEVRGPPVGKAFDASGKPTKAAEGFCRKNGVASSDIFRKADEKGSEYIFANVASVGRAAAAVLSEELPGVIEGLAFPKTMRWSSQVAYSRPLRWIMAMHGNHVVPFSYAGLLSGRQSRVLRNAPHPTIEVASAEAYSESIAAAGITIGIEQRRDSIWSDACSLAAAIGGQIPEEARGALLDEVANLVEAPAPLLGRFDERFLELPREVLTTVMRKHQRYFPVERAGGGELLPAFVAVPNGSLDEAVVRRGNEDVLRARYEDAQFFYRADVARPLASFRRQLEGVIFQAKLGSMLAKSERVELLVVPLGEALGLQEAAVETAVAASGLAMCDLATSMTFEFSSAHVHFPWGGGRESQVAEAVFESVLPRSASDALPRTDGGILLAIANRLDSIVGLFGAGCEPTASADPFGLRRSAYALVSPRRPSLPQP